MILITEKVFKFGAISFILSGVLFTTYFIVTSFVPIAPFDAVTGINWINEWRLFIAIADELLFFATVFLLPSICIFANLFKANQYPFVLAGCTIIQFLVIPIFILIVLLQGRLAYPVYNYHLSIDIIIFIVSLSIGAMHASSILLAISIVLLCLSLRKGLLGSLPVFIGVIASFGQLLSAYPWLIASIVNLLCQLLFPIWLVLIGILLLVKKDEFLPFLEKTSA